MATRVTLGEETFEVVNKNVTGVSQKGPFVNGSTVTLYELSKVNMSQTGKSFIGNITTDDGLFKVSNINLTSSYVKVTANGYYRNEVTGGKSTSQITLNALTDLTDRENVNVNLLTHLEYGRANHLLNEEGQRISTAKKIAKNDVFNAFYVTGISDNTEDLNIFTEGEGNAALLAVSILLQGDLSDADLTARLSAFSTDLEKDGTWDDVATRKKIANWALRRIVQDSLKIFRKNVESWGLGEVPDFEKYIVSFVENELGVNYFAECENGETVGLDDLAIVCKDSKWNENYMVDKRDGQLYKTVKIGGQIWMAENLNYDPGDVPDMGSYAWHGCYGNVEANCTTYGRLYTWVVAMNNAACAYGKTCNPSGAQQGICPDGWHLPTKNEFETMLSVTGKKISANSWLSNDDVFGFSLLPAGRRYDGGNFYGQGSYADLWSSSENDSFDAYYLYVYDSAAYMNYGYNKFSAFSLRCLKD